MKKLILIFLLLVLVAGAVIAWIFLGPATKFSDKKETLYIRSHAATKKAVLDSLRANGIIGNEAAFNFLAGRLDYWKQIKPGKYDFRKGSSLLTIVRTLRNGTQTPVNLTITKLRTREDLARLVGNKFECDSQQMADFLFSPDSLKNFDTEPEQSLWNVLPDTYTYFWNSDPSDIYKKMAAVSKKFWTPERVRKAEKLGLSPQQSYILASIVEEETNKLEEKDTIASVYLNRIKKGMPLQADPTVKFAVKDFSIKWIHGEMLNSPSPYNTYRVRGLPPGPICTPSKKTLDAVLDAPQTDYLYFVANSNFTGSHLFSATYEEHLVKAAAYQQEDKRRREEKQGGNPTN